MKIDLNYNDIDFKEKIINLPKGVKEVNIYGDNIDTHLFLSSNFIVLSTAIL